MTALLCKCDRGIVSRTRFIFPFAIYQLKQAKFYLPAYGVAALYGIQDERMIYGPARKPATDSIVDEWWMEGVFF